MVNCKFSKDVFRIFVLLCIFSTFSTFSFLFVINHEHKVYGQKDMNDQSFTTSSVKIKDLIIHVDLAITSDQQAKGLSIKNTLNDSEGMLFPFNTPGEYAFWMKDMKFPIDIIWINSNHEIVHIEKNIQPCIFFLLCNSYFPHANSKYVLEVNSNYTTKNNIAVGDKVSFNIANSTNQ